MFTWPLFGYEPLQGYNNINNRITIKPARI